MEVELIVVKVSIIIFVLLDFKYFDDFVAFFALLFEA